MKTGKIILVVALAAMLAFVYAALPNAPASEEFGEDEAVLGAPSVPAATHTFTITGTAPTFTVSPNPATMAGSTTGTIQAIIDLIEANTGTDDIKKLIFGTGGATIDIGSNSASLKKGKYIIEGIVTSSAGNTFYLQNDGTTLFMTTGTIENTFSGGDTIVVNVGCAANISGGTVRATGTDATAICDKGTVNISSGAIITSVCNLSGFGTIYVRDSGVLNVEGGTVRNTSASGSANAIHTTSTSALNISGGMVSTTTGCAIRNSEGPVNVSGGTVSATTGMAIYHNSGNAVNISGGTVSAGNNIAIYLASVSVITISGTTTKVTSANTSSTGGTICLAGIGTSNAARLIVQGGTVENTSTGDSYANTVYNSSPGAVNVSGGTVSATTGTAIRNNSTGAVNVSGGTVSATTGTAIYNSKEGVITISGTTTSVTSANSSNTSGTICLASSGSSTDARLNIEGGIVRNTSTNSSTDNNAIYNNSAGAVNISGGTVSTTDGVAISNNSSGAVNITSGTLTTGGTVVTIYNTSTGTVNVSGGTVTSTGYYAIINYSAGTLNFSGGTVTGSSVYSAINNYGTMNVSGGTLSATGGGRAITNYGTLTITGGTVSATTGTAIYNTSGAVNVSGGTISVTTSGVAIYNNGVGPVNVSGGTVSAESGNALFNYASGQIFVSGGEVSATAGKAIYNNSTGAVNVSGGTVSATDGEAIFNAGAGTINISEADPDVPTLVTSANTSDTSGTIYLNNAGGAVYITGGMANNTAGGNVIWPLQPLLEDGDNVHITVPIAVTSKRADVAKSYDGSPVTLSASFKGLIIFIEAQWYKNGEPVPGATSMTLDVTEIGDSGVYELKVKYWGDGAVETFGSGPISVSITAASTPGGDTGGSEGGGGGFPVVLIVVIIAVIAAAGFAAYWFLLRKP